MAPDRCPWLLEVRPRLLMAFRSAGAGNDIDADAGQAVEDVERRRIQHDRLLAGLGIWQQQQSAFEIDMFPLEMEDLPQSGAGEDQQPKRGCGKAVDDSRILHLRKMFALPAGI